MASATNESQSPPNPSDEANKEVHEEVRVPTPYGEMTDEEADLIRAKGQKLLRSDERVRTACVNLVYARRLYNVALQSLNRRMDDLEVDTKVEFFLTEAMKHQAGTEFTRQELLDQLSGSCLPWLVAEIQDEKDRELQLVAKDVANEEIARRQQILPLPFEPEMDWATRALHGLPGLDRKKTLTLAGHPGAVQCVLDLMMTFLLRLKESPQFLRPTVVRLVTELLEHNVLHEKHSLPFHKIGANRWLHAGRSVKVMHETLNPFLGTLIRGKIDVCLVDDASQLREPMPIAVPAWQLAGNVQRNAHKWAQESGTALVLGVPFKTERDITKHWDGIQLDEQWTQLEVYTDLVQLVVIEDSPTTYAIKAMRHNDPTNLTNIGSVPRDVLLTERRPTASDPN
jgi:hypothetical protein